MLYFFCRSAGARESCPEGQILTHGTYLCFARVITDCCGAQCRQPCCPLLLFYVLDFVRKGDAFGLRHLGRRYVVHHVLAAFGGGSGIRGASTDLERPSVPAPAGTSCM